jgi:uncharacterized protein with HEPN domain
LFDTVALIERLESALEAMERIPRRFTGINSPEDFEASEAGQDRLDAICMILVAVGEAFKQIDLQTDGRLLSHYPQVDWRGVIGVRNVIAHGYFDIDVEQVFDICQKDIPALIMTIRKMIVDLRQGSVF